MIHNQKRLVLLQLFLLTLQILLLVRIVSDNNIISTAKEKNTITTSIKNIDYEYFSSCYLYSNLYLNKHQLPQLEENTNENIIIEEEEEVKNYIDYKVPKNKGFKSFMGYDTITTKNSYQYILQRDYAYTGENGIRMVNGRYCMAIGSFFNVEIGQYFDVMLLNGTVIKCIKGDAKADIHTNEMNIFTVANGCCSEFLVDKKVMDEYVKMTGNMSNCKKEWQSPVYMIRVYDYNVLR